MRQLSWSLLVLALAYRENSLSIAFYGIVAIFVLPRLYRAASRQTWSSGKLNQHKSLYVKMAAIITGLSLYQQLMPFALASWQSINGVGRVDQSLHLGPIEWLLVCTIVPVIEELLFRRWLFRKALHLLPVIPAGLVVSAAFAWLHFDFVHSFIFSSLLCYAYYKSRSLRLIVALHAANNLSMNYAYLIQLLFDWVDEQSIPHLYPWVWWLKHRIPGGQTAIYLTCHILGFHHSYKITLLFQKCTTFATWPQLRSRP